MSRVYVATDRENAQQEEIERLKAELAEFHNLKEYAKTLGQETYLELHARNEQLRADEKEYRESIALLRAEVERLTKAKDQG